MKRTNKARTKTNQNIPLVSMVELRSNSQVENTTHRYLNRLTDSIPFLLGSTSPGGLTASIGNTVLFSCLSRTKNYGCLWLLPSKSYTSYMYKVQGNILKVKIICNISLVHLLDTFKSLVMGNVNLLKKQADTIGEVWEGESSLVYNSL